MDLRTAETTLEFAEEASAAATGPDAKDALERLETRLDDLLAAMTWFLESRPDRRSLPGRERPLPLLDHQAALRRGRGRVRASARGTRRR